MLMFSSSLCKLQSDASAGMTAGTVGGKVQPALKFRIASAMMDRAELPVQRSNALPCRSHTASWQ